MSNLIKVLATIFLVLGTLACFIGGVILLFSGDVGVFIGFLLIMVGVPAMILSWALMFGFAQLIDNSEIIADSNAQLIKINKALLMESIAKDEQNNISRKTRLKFWKATGIISDASYELELKKLEQTPVNPSAAQAPEDPTE